MSDGSDATNADGARRVSDSSDDGPVLAADGRPLKQSLQRALRRQKLRALGLIAPLLIFILVTFIAPIADMLFRSVENQIVSDTLPQTVQTLADWDPDSGELPGQEVFRDFYFDLAVAAQRKKHTQLGTRLNYELTGVSSLFRRSGRRIDDIGEVYMDQFEDLNAAWGEEMTWARLMGSEDWLQEQEAWNADAAAADEADRDFDRPLPAFEFGADVRAELPRTAAVFDEFAHYMRTDNQESVMEDEPWEVAYAALYEDLMANPDAAAAFSGENATILSEAADAVPKFQAVDYKAAILETEEGWSDPQVWATIQTFSPDYTTGYFLNAVDLQMTPDGIQAQPRDQQIYVLLFKRTLFMSLMIMGSCVVLGYPIAYLLSNLPLRESNMLMILVLLPFWTSLLVRTSAWKVLLQQQGVINDLLVWLGLVADDSRLVMINNQFGTIVAMTHILLPFMILPLYSVMKTIPPSYVRAAKSLGATNWTAFWRVYFPQSVPGIGAGCILVFILSIGYYITPELVGGTTGTFISNRIAYHISSSLNWGLAAALGSILLAVVLLLYWVYDKIVGIDNVSLG